ncbi:hypothetical protein BD410DRAFT_797697, partial [Rickenella mellea]
MSSNPQFHGLFPGFSVPMEALPSILAGSSILFISIFSITTGNPAWSVFRIAIAPIAIYFFWDYGYGLYPTAANQVAVGMAFIALYFIMRAVETTFDDFLDDKPPLWVYDGKELPLPKTVAGRALYSLDLLTSLRGNSWFENTHWNWASKEVLNPPCSTLSRSRYVKQALISCVLQYIVIDILDTINRSRTWDLSNPHPITSLPISEQMIFSVSLCALTALGITFPYAIMSGLAVALGSPPANWPPMFDSPFSATSLANFWGQRWHLIFRRVFSRLTTGILRILSMPPAISPYKRKFTRAVLAFVLSAGVHVVLMYRLHRENQQYPYTFFDPSILKFFLSQPLGLAVEAFLIIPLSRTLLLEKSHTMVTRVWAWTFMVWSGRFWSDAWVHGGLWGERERGAGFSVVRG